MKLQLFLPLTIAACLLGQTPAAAPKAKPAAAKSAKPAATKPPAASKTGVRAAPVAFADPAVLTIGDIKITAKEFNAMLEALPENVRAQAQGPMKRSIAEQVIRVKLLASEARKRGLDKDPALQTRVALQAESVLASAAFNDMLQKTAVDDAAARKYYEEHKNEWEKADARHILIKFKGSPVPQREGKPELTEEQALAKAQELKKRIAGGEDFAKIAVAESDDTGSGNSGGNLGSFGRGQMVGPFDQAVFTLPVGHLSDPIKTQFGYHLIQVQKREAKAFEEARAEIESKLKPETTRQQVESIRKQTNVVFDTAYFGPEPDPKAPAPGVQVPVQVSPAPAPAAK
jgi:parvulin-like peptidyl-prolyl isomerase